MKNKIKNFLLIALLVTFLSGCSIDGLSKNKNSNSLDSSSTKKLNSFHISFVDTELENNSKSKQTEVQQVLSSKNDKSIVMVPGLGLSPYIYMTTPDNREGWAEIFSNNGFNSHVINPPRNISSGIVHANNLEDSSFSQWRLDRVWSKWGFGSEVNKPYEDVKFPIEYIDQFASSFPVYTNSTGGVSANNNVKGSSSDKNRKKSIEQSDRDQNIRKGGGKFGSEKEVNAIINLLKKSGPSALMVHSASGASGFEVIKQRPDLVTSLIVVEPVGCPTSLQEDSNLIEVPFLAVYGDYIKERGQMGRMESCEKTVSEVKKIGGKSKILNLVDQGIKGNTHIMMQDKNNKTIAKKIISWINKN